MKASTLEISGYTEQVAPHPRSSEHTSFVPEHNDIAEVDQLTPQQKFAKNAVSRFFIWLQHSPNNPSYLTSETYLGAHNWLTAHEEQLEQDIANRATNVSYDHLDHDASELFALFNKPNRKLWDERGTLEAKMFHAEDIAYAGIKDIVQKARANSTYELPLNGLEQLNQDTVAAIGAQIVRLGYLGELSNMHPSAISKQQLKAFEQLYRQNIVSDIQRAALVKKHVEQTSLKQTASANVVSIK